MTRTARSEPLTDRSENILPHPGETKGEKGRRPHPMPVPGLDQSDHADQVAGKPEARQEAEPPQGPRDDEHIGAVSIATRHGSRREFAHDETGKKAAAGGSA